jgi:Mor transcription activator family
MDIEICMDDLPPVLRLMAELVGLPKCLLIVELFGGSRLIVPRRGLALDHKLRYVLSDVECDRISHYFQGCVEIPCAKIAKNVARDREIWRDSNNVRNPMSIRQLSVKYELTERQIYKSIAAYELRVGKISDSIKSNALAKI